MFDPGEGLVLLVGTIVDIVEEEDIGFECEVPAGLAPKETRIYIYQYIADNEGYNNRPYFIISR